MKLKHIFSAAIISLIACACQNSQNNKENQNQNNDTKVDQPNASLDTNFYKQLVGTINETIHITMDLVKQDSIFTGTYYYNKIGKPLNLHGHLTHNANEIELSEYNENGNKTGTFLGIYDANNSFSGTWTNAKTNKALPFSLLLNHSSNIAAAIATHHYAENCNTRDSLLKIMNEDELPNYQRVCAYIDINLITIETPNKAVSKLINNLILKDVCHDIGETQYRDIPEFLASLNQLSLDEAYQMNVNCSIKTNHNNVLSFEISNSSFTGGAHPNGGSTIYNFDLRNGNIITLRDFINEQNELKLATIAETIFEQTHGKGYDYEPGKFYLAKNFILSTEGIYFIYNTYEIGSYAAGAPDVFIPYKDIKHLIEPNTILTNLMAN